jgi:hypothetical protein
MERDRRDVLRLPGAALLALALVVPSTDLLAATDKSIAVRGRVTDATGEAVPGHTVRLLKSRTIVNLGSFQKRDQNVEEMRSTTNAQGFFASTIRPISTRSNTAFPRTRTSRDGPARDVPFRWTWFSICSRDGLRSRR